MPWGLSLPCYLAAHRHSLKCGEEDERAEREEREEGEEKERREG